MAPLQCLPTVMATFRCCSLPSSTSENVFPSKCLFLLFNFFSFSSHVMLYSLSLRYHFSKLILSLSPSSSHSSRYDLRGHLKDNSIRGSIKMIENLKTKKKSKGKGDSNDWTWSELACLVKYSKVRHSHKHTETETDRRIDSQRRYCFEF